MSDSGVAGRKNVAVQDAIRVLRAALAAARSRKRGSAGKSAAGFVAFDRAALRALLSKHVLDGIVDQRTLERALGPSFELNGAVRSRRRQHPPRVLVIRNSDASAIGSFDVACVDLEELGVDTARKWAGTHRAQVLARGGLLVAAVGPQGVDFEKIIGLFDAVVSRPVADSDDAWSDACRNTWLARKSPEDVDRLPSERTRGAIPREIAIESLADATSPVGNSIK